MYMGKINRMVAPQGDQSQLFHKIFHDQRESTSSTHVPIQITIPNNITKECLVLNGLNFTKHSKELTFVKVNSKWISWQVSIDPKQLSSGKVQDLGLDPPALSYYSGFLNIGSLHTKLSQASLGSALS